VFHYRFSLKRLVSSIFLFVSQTSKTAPFFFSMCLRVSHKLHTKYKNEIRLSESITVHEDEKHGLQRHRHTQTTHTIEYMVCLQLCVCNVLSYVLSYIVHTTQERKTHIFLDTRPYSILRFIPIAAPLSQQQPTMSTS
jgi:hypothetical protein